METKKAGFINKRKGMGYMYQYFYEGFGVNSNTQLVIEIQKTGDGLLHLLMLEHL